MKPLSLHKVPILPPSPHHMFSSPLLNTPSPSSPTQQPAGVTAPPARAYHAGSTRSTFQRAPETPTSLCQAALLDPNRSRPPPPRAHAGVLLLSSLFVFQGASTPVCRRSKEQVSCASTRGRGETETCAHARGCKTFLISSALCRLAKVTLFHLYLFSVFGSSNE